jgi:hypothetical protein
MRPASVADVLKAKKDAQDRAINITWAIFFSVMRDKEGWGRTRLARLWSEIEDLSDSITKGYVSVNDLMNTLRDEIGINLKR